MAERYDVIIIGSGAGGGTLAHRLAPSGKKILILERGDWLPREARNWNVGDVFGINRYVSPDAWLLPDGKSFQPQVHYFVGGATKLFGAALYRLRKEDFGELKHYDGVSPAWPISYDDVAPWYDKVAQEMNFPPSLQADFQGTAASFRNSLSNEALLILAALVTVYIVLGVLYESFIHPVTILSTLPSAGVGALLALMLFGEELSVVAIIGIILLIGIVKKNGIMMVDFALEAEREHGKSSTDAIYEACLLRFRPIMMTTMAALLGGIPLALGRGIGSELRRPLGICMVGGLLLSQVLTLYTTPVIYIFFDNLGKRVAGKREKNTEGHQPPAEAAGQS